MRELKFRAWDKEDKKYLLPENQEFVILPTKPSFGATIPFQSESYPNENLDIDCVDWADADLIMGRYELEQYTGLKDKNGKEIYEGDIIKFADLELAMKPTGVVCFADGKFFVKDWEFDDGSYHIVEFYDYNIPHRDFEVIGNIHENPELLEGEE